MDISRPLKTWTTLPIERYVRYLFHVVIDFQTGET